MDEGFEIQWNNLASHWRPICQEALDSHMSGDTGWQQLAARLSFGKHHNPSPGISISPDLFIMSPVRWLLTETSWRLYCCLCCRHQHTRSTAEALAQWIGYAIHSFGLWRLRCINSRRPFFLMYNGGLITLDADIVDIVKRFMSYTSFFIQMY